MASLWNIVRSLFGGNSNSDPNFTFVEGDDPEMQAAFDKARASVLQFVEKMDDPQFADAEFYVKKRFDQDGLSEHMWLSVVRVEGSEFVGLVGNDPQIVTHVTCGDEARVAFNEISDWMITQGDDMTGGFTVEVLMRRQG